jgi:rhodanese-related sulfurtransferase
MYYKISSELWGNLVSLWGESMFELKKLRFLVGGLMVGMLLLGACVTDESVPAPTEDPLDAQDIVEAAETGPATEVGEAKELGDDMGTGPTSENPEITDRSEVPQVTVEELKDLIDKGAPILIGDTRVDIAYNLGHIPGAVLATGSQVKTYLDQIQPDQEIILYCACVDEYSSAGAALTLYDNGYLNVSVLLGGIDRWKDAGYSLEES